MPPVTFVHLSDLHVGAPGAGDAGLRSDTSATLRAVRAMIEALDPAPAFVAVSGDLTDRGDAASYRHLAGLMEGFPLPVLWALGNHDSRPGFHEGFLGAAAGRHDPYDHEAVLAGVHVITLDTSRPGRIGGDLDEGQFAFLAAALGRHPGVPKLLMIHHGPNLDGDPEGEWESLTLAATLRLAGLVAGSGLAGILSGHIHRDRVALWHGVPVVTPMGQHFALDPLVGGDGIRGVAGAGFALCTLRPGGLAVSFVPLPSDRREIARVSRADLAAHEARAAAAAR